MDRAEAFVPEFSSRYLDFSAKRSVEWYARTARISSSGVLGDPGRASAEKGAKIWETMIANLLELVEELKSMTLDEIYERRY
jgi:creatinine amidohydrolase/Fe(II)-dependent formamide hydrolase-like protein